MKLQLQEQPESNQSQAFLFHRDSFIFRNKGSFILSYGNGHARISIAFHPENDVLNSLSRSSFGSFDLSGDVDTDMLREFIRQMEKHPVISGYTHLRIRSYPRCYSPKHWDMIDHALIRQEFEVRYTDLNMHLDLSEPWEKNLHYTEKRYLTYAKNEGWALKRLDPQEFLTSCYALFLQSRKNKGYPMTMNEGELRDMFTLFPEEYLLFGIFEQDRLIAASVSIIIRNDILYNLYHGDDLEYRSRSPVVYLNSALYDYAHEYKMKILDMGICSESGVVNPGLHIFKKKLGGIESPKTVYEKSLK